jgi:glutathione S-transferase
MKLYDCQIAPNPRRVRIFLAEKAVEIERVELNIAEGDNLKPDFLAINPRGLLPTLVLDDGTALDEVVAISRYIEETHPEPPLMGTSTRERAFIESRNRHMEIDGFMSVAEIFRNTHPSFRERGLPGVSAVPAIPQLVERGRAGIARFFERLNSYYLGQRPFVAGDQFSIADITALSVVDFAKWVEEKVPSNHVNTLRWYEAVSQRPSATA